MSGTATKERKEMNYKKPVRDLDEQNKRICPICGKRSYSARGIHPQCAVDQSDAARRAEIVANKKANERDN